MLLAAEEHHDTFHHVRDSQVLELPNHITISLDWLPGFELTKFMLLQVIAFLLVLWIFRGLAQRAASGEPVRGRWWNFWESLAMFVRDEVVRPTIGDGHHDHDHDHGDDHGHGHHGEPVVEGHGANLADIATDGTIALDASHFADRYLPFVWSCFFYVLICNLLGAIPFLGSATGSLNVTGALAVVVFGAVFYYGSQEMGVIGFWKNLCPSMDLPGPIAVVLLPMIWLIELLGLAIKHGVLAVRLFANIMAGHTVIAVILGFIGLAAHAQAEWIWYAVTPASILGQVAIGMLELFVAFLQAYVFAFLATLFIGAAIHKH